jgi:hypothetical protein
MAVAVPELGVNVCVLSMTTGVEEEVSFEALVVFALKPPEHDVSASTMTQARTPAATKDSVRTFFEFIGPNTPNPKRRWRRRTSLSVLSLQQPARLSFLPRSR